MAATIGATVVVHELKKDVHQQYKLPINIFRTGKGCGKYYDASTPEAKEHVMLMQNILWLFDPEQSTNNRLDFNPEKQEHVTNYVKLLIKARKELVDIGKTALNHELAKKFVKAGVADEDGNEYANEDDFVKVLEAVKKRFAHESAIMYTKSEIDIFVLSDSVDWVFSNIKGSASDSNASMRESMVSTSPSVQLLLPSS